jgi:hypothetical protein
VLNDFYSTVAAVMPIVLLALVWDSELLRRLPSQNRTLRRIDPGGVHFWTRPRVRVYTISVAGAVMCAIAIAAFVLGGILSDSIGLRWFESCVLCLELGTLLTRITVDVTAVTKQGA